MLNRQAHAGRWRAVSAIVLLLAGGGIGARAAVAAGPSTLTTGRLVSCGSDRGAAARLTSGAARVEAAPQGCIWPDGTVVINSDNDYRIQATDGVTLVTFVIHSQCRALLTFSSGRQSTVVPQSVGLKTYQPELTSDTVDVYNRLGKWIDGFRIKPIDETSAVSFKSTSAGKGARTTAGQVTTQQDSPSGTLIRITPSTFSFPALLSDTNGSVIPNVNAPTLFCAVTGGEGIHVATSYVSRVAEYGKTQLNETVFDAPTSYQGTGVFPETKLLRYVLLVFLQRHPQAPKLLLQTATVTGRSSKDIIGYTSYKFDLHRSTPCPAV